MSSRPVEDIGSLLTLHDACGTATSAGVPILTIAGATEDNVEVTGETIDRIDSSTGAMAMSAVLCTTYNATLANTKTITFAHEYQLSADGSSWDTAVAIEAATTEATGDGVSTEFRGVSTFDLDLSAHKRYIRFNVTPNLSNTSTDAASWHTVAVLGGYNRIPV